MRSGADCLVEFVDLDERATAFPGGGWLTRRNLESEISQYGPKALTAQQTAMADAVRRSQEGSKRREISFTGARTSDRRERDDRDHERPRERDRRDDRHDRGGRDRRDDRRDRRDRRDRDERDGASRPKNGWDRRR